MPKNAIVDAEAARKAKEALEAAEMAAKLKKKGEDNAQELVGSKKPKKK